MLWFMSQKSIYPCIAGTAKSSKMAENLADR